MPLDLSPLRFVTVALAGWLNQQQQDIIDYLREENKVLREQLGNRRLRLNNEQRRRLAARAKKLGHKVLADQFAARLMHSIHAPPCGCGRHSVQYLSHAVGLQRF